MTLDQMRTALGHEEPIPFTPAPRLRSRRNGWDDKTQADFIAALSLCGSVRAAAEAVGRSARSAYKLLDAPGADDFARAWDEALDTGLSETRTRSLQRALFGELVPVFRKGVMTGLRHKRSDRLALAVLAAGTDDGTIADRARSARHRRESHAAWKAFDERKAAEKREAEERAAEYQRQVDAMIARGHSEDRLARPRVRVL